jgi:hypothetical protein
MVVDAYCIQRLSALGSGVDDSSVVAVAYLSMNAQGGQSLDLLGVQLAAGSVSSIWLVLTQEGSLDQKWHSFCGRRWCLCEFKVSGVSFQDLLNAILRVVSQQGVSSAVSKQRGGCAAPLFKSSGVSVGCWRADGYHAVADADTGSPAPDKGPLPCTSQPTAGP